MENTLEKIQKAADGLLFMSESDNPLEVVSFSAEELGELTPEAVVKAAGKTAGTPVEKQDLTFFFRNQTRDLPEHSDEDKTRAKHFQELENLLKQELKAVEVYRIGKTQVEAYILGKLPDGKIGGLKTLLIET
jgi:histidine triad (HIT) family protein